MNEANGLITLAAVIGAEIRRLQEEVAELKEKFDRYYTLYEYELAEKEKAEAKVKELEDLNAEQARKITELSS
jgi:hypothetical protein